MNLKGLLYMMCFVVLGMVVCGIGYIINVCLMVGKEVYFNGNVYNVIKFGVDGLIKVMCMDLYKYGVCVGMVSFVYVEEMEFVFVCFDGDESCVCIYEDFKFLASYDVVEFIYFIVI